MTKTQTRHLPEVQKKRLHPDFVKNEQQYWRMRGELFKQYQGKWVAIHQGRVVAVSQDIFNITDQVGELGCHAYIAKVGKEDKVVFQVRRKDFAYDTSYQLFALPQVDVTFSNKVTMMPFTKCPVCGGELIEKEVEKLLRGGIHTAVLRVRAEVCLHCGERLYSQETVRRFAEVRAKLERQETADFQPLGQSFQVV